jgi:excisionase family DNA binding protein
LEPITASIPEFCRISGLGRSTVYEMLGDGSLDSITIGRRRLILIDSYRRLIEARRAASAQPPTAPLRPCAM